MELTLGTGQVFGPDALSRVRVKRSIDPIFGYLQQDSMEVSLLGHGDLEEAAGRQTTAVLSAGGKTVATQQVCACSRQGVQQKLLCRTDLEFLQLEHMGGVYRDQSGMGLLRELLGDRELDMTVDSLGTVNGHIPICTRGQAMRMLTLALGACLRVNPQGEFSLLRLADTGEKYIGPGRICAQPVLTQLPAYSKVELVTHSYTPAQNPVAVFSSREFPDQVQTVKFDEPVHWIQLDQGVELEQGANYLTFQPAQLDTLLVKPYLHTDSWLSRSLTQWPEHTRVLSVRDNTLIGPDNGPWLLEQLCRRAQMCQQLELRVRVQDEDVGDLVTVDTPWGVPYTGYITAMESVYTRHSQVARITVMGQRADR